MEVIDNREITDNVFILRLELTENALKPEPGQFYLLRPDSGYDPLLGRPFSAFRWNNDWIEFLIRKTGRGTALLSTFRPGDHIRILGPLGRSFPPHSPHKTPVVLAGGIGMASVYSLTLKHKAEHIFIYGAKSATELLLTEDIRPRVRELYLCTDDGSMGFQGNVVEFFTEFLKKTSSHSIVVYACGPEKMTKSLMEILKKYNIESYLSLEERMACGLGACMGCAKDTKTGMKRVCMEGPVFNIEEL
ncbi:MAG: dihydroorotate dehydrogenase electron transfer subunit [Nitrospirae bacterium]|nr:dihydroorotate dehydrogenase electron transfer subunit [Nitrospirota bacterium]